MKNSFLSILLFLSLSTLCYSQELTVEKIWKNREFSEAYVDGFKSMNDGEHFTKISENEGKSIISIHSFSDYNGKGDEILSLSSLKLNNKTIEIDDYEFNQDETKLLFSSERKPIYRRSYSAVFYLYDLKTKSLQSLDDKHSPQTLAEYSPDGNKVSYIYNNNLFVKHLSSGVIEQITFDGEKNSIINGTTDWVYEEEFSITKGYNWSHDSKHIAFLKFDESKVQEFTMAYYKDLYPTQYTFKYPKAGEDNSKVTCHIYSIDTKESKQLSIGEYEYIPRLNWSNSENKLILQTLNRHQNQLRYHLIDLKENTYTSKIFFEENASTYVEIDDNLLILSDGKTILRTSEADGYNHIYQLGFDGKTTQITKGNWDVVEFLGINEKTKTLFYTSVESGTINKGIYKINLNGKSKKLISTTEGTNDAEFSNGMHYFIKTYSNANTPNIITLCNENGKELNILENNQALASKLKFYKVSPKKFIQIKGVEKDLNAWIIYPPLFDSTKSYPVFLTIYGGPGHNTVLNSFDGNDYIYHQLLAQKGYIIVSVDPRGTMYRGAEFKKSTYLQLGKLETEDIIAVGKELGKLKYVDSKRIGIQGWSFGGFMTSLAMTKGADVFKTGIAVAPVTNWKYYDNIYTERFMRTPAENPTGYESNSPINFVNQLKGNFLLIHGSGDDNVHYQNSMEMINSLVKENKQFDMFIYPNKNHSIYGGNTRNHLFNLMLNFTLEKL